MIAYDLVSFYEDKCLFPVLNKRNVTWLVTLQFLECVCNAVSVSGRVREWGAMGRRRKESVERVELKIQKRAKFED